MYIIYTEIIPADMDKPIERWYYGTYKDRNCANEIAIQMNNCESDPQVYRCVCKANDATKLEIRNLPF